MRQVGQGRPTKWPWGPRNKSAVIQEVMDGPGNEVRAIGVG